MTFVALACLIALPIGVAIRFGSSNRFRVLPTVLAAVVGELVGILLFGLYNRWKVAEFFAKKTRGGGVVYFGPVDLWTRADGLLLFLGLAAGIGLLVVLIQRAYSWMRVP